MAPLVRVAHDILKKSFRIVHDLLFDRRQFWNLALLILSAEIVLCSLIVRHVNFTEIDFQTYLQQIAHIRKGERDYSRISGDTGPLVYPAGHVLIHKFLNRVYQATSLQFIQLIYAGLYLSSFLLTASIYYRSKGVPNYVLLLLPLSKRLHSIYVLRLFNDCWSSVLMLVAIRAYSLGEEVKGSIWFSCALSVKMNVLLYFPVILLLLLKQVGLAQTILHLINIVLLQLILAKDFIFTYPKSYFKGAFDFSRQFLYKWTVNWRFIPRETFLSKTFSRSLLAAHLIVLVAFAFKKWTRTDGGVIKVALRALYRPFMPAAFALPTGDEIITILFTCNLIGVICARSLHYQFYSWYAQQLPFLAWRTKYPAPLKVLLLGAIEYGWNVYPSTNLSSSVLLGSHLLLLIGIWFGYPTGMPRRKVAFKMEPETEPDVSEFDDSTDRTLPKLEEVIEAIKSDPINKDFAQRYQNGIPDERVPSVIL